MMERQRQLQTYRKLRLTSDSLQANREELSTLDASDGRPWVCECHHSGGKIAMISTCEHIIPRLFQGQGKMMTAFEKVVPLTL